MFARDVAGADPRTGLGGDVNVLTVLSVDGQYVGVDIGVKMDKSSWFSPCTDLDSGVSVSQRVHAVGAQ